MRSSTSSLVSSAKQARIQSCKSLKNIAGLRDSVTNHLIVVFPRTLPPIIWLAKFSILGAGQEGSQRCTRERLLSPSQCIMRSSGMVGCHNTFAMAACKINTVLRPFTVKSHIQSTVGISCVRETRSVPEVSHCKRLVPSRASPEVKVSEVGRDTV